jgi:UDP-GlcNAc:undecaprenyl-phosphate/decaprenyl-phosphate GlcNAc-1-phosphate transferase
MPWGAIYSLGIASLPVTVFWIILVINAINLIDGLDGLAAGVSLFATISLLTICLINNDLAVAFALAALAGACLGFLRYNFNPASIFMGDGGSYFLGYMLASLGILGSRPRWLF